MTDLISIVLLGSTFASMVYYLLSWVSITRYSRDSTEETNPVSVIICAHNELNNLKNLIPILENQNHPDFEIIIVDDRSDDGTYDFMLGAKSQKIKNVRIESVPSHINPKKFAVTLGVKAAKNDILLFTDADCLPNSDDWAQKMTNNLSEKTFFSLGVSQYAKGKGFLNCYIRYETHLTALNYISWAIAGNPYMGVGRNLAYRKSMFLREKGFHKIQQITGGDDDLLVNRLANKKNARVVLGSDSLMNSIPKRNWSDYVQQKLRHFSVSKYYSTSDKFLLGFQNLVNTTFWISLITYTVTTAEYKLPIGILVFRWVMLMNMSYFTSKKFGDRINTWLVPVLDLFYSTFVVLVGAMGILTKKVRWK